MPVTQYAQMGYPYHYQIHITAHKLLHADATRIKAELNSFIDKNREVGGVDATSHFLYAGFRYEKNMDLSKSTSNTIFEPVYFSASADETLHSSLCKEFDAFLGRCAKFKSDQVLIIQGLDLLMKRLSPGRHATERLPNCLIDYVPPGFPIYRDKPEVARILVQQPGACLPNYVDVLPIIEAYSIANLLM